MIIKRPRFAISVISTLLILGGAGTKDAIDAVTGRKPIIEKLNVLTDKTEQNSAKIDTLARAQRELTDIFNAVFEVEVQKRVKLKEDAK